MTTDTIADMLTRIRNANLAKHQIVQIPATKVTKSIAQVLLAQMFKRMYKTGSDKDCVTHVQIIQEHKTTIQNAHQIIMGQHSM